MIQLKSTDKIYHIHKKNNVKKWFAIIFVFGVVVLFLPWTQNVQVTGKVSTLYQDQRPQQLNSPIPGKIIKWHVKNGDYVKRGDTLLQLAEIKDTYMDPNLIERTQQQVTAKQGVRNYYEAKITTTNNQIEALKSVRNLKLEQLKVKMDQLESRLEGEEAELEAIKAELSLSEDQHHRQKKMYEEGLVSLTQFQQRTLTYQNAIAKKTSAENKVMQTKQDILNASIEQQATRQDYTEKLNKMEGDRFQSLGQIESNDGEIAKLETEMANYLVRQGLYFVLASQDGQVIQLNKSGIGEILKESESIGTVVPTDVAYAVEINIKPVDLPLFKVGQRVMCVFDGFPAIVFSGWPNSSYGTFAGKVIAVESNISPSGFFRALVVPDSESKPWPPQIKIGTGTQGIAILNDVPIWYELWRNINGFPPDYYMSASEKQAMKE